MLNAPNAKNLMPSSYTKLDGDMLLSWPEEFGSVDIKELEDKIISSETLQETFDTPTVSVNTIQVHSLFFSHNSIAYRWDCITGWRLAF